MKNSFFASIALIFLFSAPIFGQQQEKPKEPEEVAAIEALRLEKLLNLEPHQSFYIDSILQHDMRALYNELQDMQKSGMQDVNSYKTVRERWMAQIETGYQKVFTPDQWTLYLKSQGKLKKEKPAKKDKAGRKSKEK